MGTPYQGNQQSSTGMPNLNAVVQTPMTLNALVRPKSAVLLENITKVYKIVLADRKLKLREIADTLKITEGSVFTIFHKSLGIRKLFLKWVPCLLAPDQKQQRAEDSERCLELFNRGKKDFQRRHVTMDETWIHHYTPETKRLSVE